MKKIISTIAVFILIVACLPLAACSGEAGKSAYEIACDNGFVGTEQEWLDSLSGTDGSTINIYDLFEAYCDIYPDATFEDFLNAYLRVDYYDITNAVTQGIQSAVSVYCTFEKTGKPPQNQASTYYSAGAGVIYKIRGDIVYIITNYHVVYDRESNGTDGIAKNITVYTYGMEFSKYTVSAEFVGGSITKDIAVLKSSLTDFYSDIRAADLADSNEVSLGERTVAIGNPSAEGISITSGVVSVDSEEIEMEALDSSTSTIFLRVIRTDTAINSGNSGGGLYNARGQLIGIVNAKSVEDGVENIGFAIPVNVAAGIADCVIDNDSKKCLLGISVATNGYSTHYNSSANKVEITEDLVIQSVTEGSMAAGHLQEGDKLVSVRIGEESLAITRLFHLSDFLFKVRQGDTIYLIVIRNGSEMTIALSPSASDFTSLKN